jgi:hypothetical protein
MHIYMYVYICVCVCIYIISTAVLDTPLIVGIQCLADLCTY